MEVEPIRSKKDIKRMYHKLYEVATPREAECFLIGCNLALRAGDLLKLKFEDMTGSHVTIVEQKTKKRKQFPITPVVREAVKRLKQWYSEQKPYKAKQFNAVYLFQSTSNRCYHLCQPICIQWLREKFMDAAEAIGLTINIATHVMRKTYGFHAYEGGADIHYLQALFNHSTSRITLKYIGITKAEIEKMYYEYAIEV